MPIKSSKQRPPLPKEGSAKHWEAHASPSYSDLTDDEKRETHRQAIGYLYAQLEQLEQALNHFINNKS